MQQDKLMQLGEQINLWYEGKENPTAINIGKMTFDLWTAFQNSRQSIGDFTKFIQLLELLACSVLDRSPKVIGVCGAVAHKLHTCMDMVGKYLPNEASSAARMINLLQEHDLRLLKNTQRDGKIDALRRVDTDDYLFDGSKQESSDFELVKLSINEINADGTVPARKIEHFYNRENQQTNSDSLQTLQEEIRAGHYDKSPVAIGNLTLKIGRMLDADPTEINVSTAVSILNDLFSNADVDTRYVIIEAIAHKLEYILYQYGYLLQQSFQDSIDKYIRVLRQALTDKCKLEGSLQTLRLVSHGTLHYDSSGSQEGGSINEDKNFYEIISVTAKDLKPGGYVPAREVVFEDGPQRSNGWDDNNNGGPNNPNSGGGGGPNNPKGSKGGGGPDGPKYAYATTPPTPPHKHDNKPVRQVVVNYNGRKVDILDLILMAVLDSLFDSVEQFQDGAKFKLKPEVLRHSFPPYSFAYAGKQVGPLVQEDIFGNGIKIDGKLYRWPDSPQDSKEIVLNDGRKVHVEHRYGKNFDEYNVNVDALDSDPVIGTRNIRVGDTADMPAIIYACKFLEYAGAAPQITPEGDIYVANADQIYLNNDVNLMNIKNDMTRLTEFILLRSHQPLRMKALDSFTIPWPKKGIYISRDLLPYTTDIARKYWKTAPKVKVNGREFDMSSAFKSDYERK